MLLTYEDDRNEEADPVGFLYCHIIPRAKNKMNIIPRGKK